jgi:hypothetical protein
MAPITKTQAGPRKRHQGGKRLRKILIVSMALIVSLIAILPALAMATNRGDVADPGVTRAFDRSFGGPGNSEYCEKPGHRDCDDDDDDDHDDDDDDDHDDDDDDDKKPKKKKKKKWKDDD